MTTVPMAQLGGVDPAIPILAFDAAAFASTGALIVLRKPGNSIGWLLLVSGAALVATFSGFLIGAIRTSLFGPNDAPAMVFSWIGGIGIYPTLALLGLLALVFPDGRLPSPRWRPAVGSVIAALLAAEVILAVNPGPVAEGLAVNPFGVDHPVIRDLAVVAFPVGTVATLVMLALGTLGVAARFRAARGDTRQQLKWFLAGAATLAVTFPPSFIDTVFMDAPDGFTVFDLVAISSIALLPATIGLAILRYRLYEIDRLIRRTVGWVVVSALLLGVFLSGLLLIQAILSAFAQVDTIAVAVSTLITAALFQPLHRHVQAAVDRRFYRSRVDAVRASESLAARLRGEVDLASISRALEDAVSQAIAPTRQAVWLRRRSR